MTEENKVPKIRFPEFTDDWEQRKLGELSESLEYGLNAAAKEYDGENKYLRITDIDDASRVFKYDDLSSPDIPLENASDFLLNGRDIVFARTGASVGKTFRYKEIYGKVYYAGFLIRARIKQDFDPEFVYQNTLTSSYDNFIRLTSQRSGQPGVNAREYSSFSFCVPSYKEQQKIGTFFSKLDNLITLHQRKLETTQKLKQGFLQKLFPQNGKKIPELRFPEFSGDWEQRKFSDIAETRRGLTYKPENITESGGIRVLRSSNINEDTFVFSSDDVFVEPTAVKIPLVKNGDILITSANGSSRLVGKHSIVRDLVDNSAVHGGFMLLASAKEPEFVNALMGAAWYAKFINTFVAGGNGAIGNLNKSDLDNQKVLIPSIEEQKKIGQFFKSLDKLITLHQRKLEIYQNIKKGLLQQMFV